MHFISLFFILLQEQSGNEETEMQMMRTHTETLLETLRDIAQVTRTQFILTVFLVAASYDFSVWCRPFWGLLTVKHLCIVHIQLEKKG